ncbi:MAG: adenylate/guanylate cyclase domain-containing protein [Verrucomicrobiota bacterium]
MESVPPSPPGSGQRALAAIVFTDVVGFSARMQADEETTLRLLKRDFDAMRAICTQHHGSVLKTTGDGLLLYFASAVQAVACALAVQRTFAAQARGLPAGEILSHRVGIHLGDVFVNEQDVMGDGVNIAARLQAEAEPGGICISQTVYDVVRNKLTLHATRLGPRELKNITQSIPIYKLLLEAQAMGGPEPAPPPEEEPAAAPAAGGRHPVAGQKWRTTLGVAGAVALVAAVALGVRGWSRHKRALARAETEQAALNALMTDEQAAEADAPAGGPLHIARTLADWRAELRQQRSRALEEYDFAELARTLRDPGSPVAGEPEAKIRAQVLQRTQLLFGWLATHLQKYNRQNPLVVRELTGTAPKEIRVYVGADRRLYYAEGGAVRQRAWTDLPPPVLAAIVAGALTQAEPLPPREAVQGALAFAALYHLPELPAALRQGKVQRLKRR